MLTVDRYHSSLRHLIETDQDLKKIGGGCVGAMTWSPKRGQLDYTDAWSSEKYVWTPAGGEIKENTSIGKLTAMTYDCCHRIVACDSGKKSLVRFQNGESTFFADSMNGEKLEPVALSIHSCGIIYVADESGIYYVLPENLHVIKASKDAPIKPVSLCIAAEEEGILFTDANSEAVLMMDFALDATLSRVRTFAFTSEFPMGAPTDIKVDRGGNVYCAAPSGVHIFDQAGLRIGTILVKSAPTRLCFGGQDAKTLFIGTEDGIYSVDIKIEGRF
jgi:gluconolactonase